MVKNKRAKTGRATKKAAGFSLMEIIVVVAIMGILIVAAYPLVMNSLENRDIENTALLIQMTFQQAKMEAVRAKINHRVRFWQDNDGRWAYTIERETQPNQWTALPGFVPRSISNKYTVTINLPNRLVAFSPLGMVVNYNPTQRSISLHSSKLSLQGQPGTRIVYVYAGGSFQYVRAA